MFSLVSTLNTDQELHANKVIFDWMSLLPESDYIVTELKINKINFYH